MTETSPNCLASPKLDAGVGEDILDPYYAYFLFYFILIENNYPARYKLAFSNTGTFQATQDFSLRQ